MAPGRSRSARRPLHRSATAYTRKVIDAARRLLRAVTILARDGRIPMPLRGLAAFGAMPIPGPVDEVVLLLVGVLLFVFYRQSLREAWRRAGPH